MQMSAVDAYEGEEAWGILASNEGSGSINYKKRIQHFQSRFLG